MYQSPSCRALGALHSGLGGLALTLCGRSPRAQGAPPDKLLGYVFESLLDVHAAEQIKEWATLLRGLLDESADKGRTRRLVLQGVVDLVNAPIHGEGMLAMTPKILMALYDIDILDEATLLRWHAQAAGQEGGAGAKAREAAAPLIRWLKEAEEEESANGRSSGDEAE